MKQVVSDGSGYLHPYSVTFWHTPCLQTHIFTNSDSQTATYANRYQ